MTYLVMECHPGFAVVLGEDGSIRKAVNLDYEVGQRIPEILELQTPGKQPGKRRWAAALTAMAACLVLAAGVILVQSRQPYASVYLTINPQVRIDVNRKDTVVAVEGLNPDGAALLAEYAFEKKNLDQVTEELVDRAIQMDYLQEGGTVEVTLEAEADWVATHEDHLHRHLDTHLSEQLQVQIQVGCQEEIHGHGQQAEPQNTQEPTENHGDKGKHKDGHGH